MKSIKRTVALLTAVIWSSGYLVIPLPAHASSSVYMEDLTWMEIRERIRHGDTVAIVPTGGTEQSGPQLVTGKHNIIVHYTAGQIAKKLGDALVAPIIPITPAGRIQPPEGHMQFPGTLSLSGTLFAKLLEETALSLRQHGFRLICFVGDHSGSQNIQQQVADKLTDEWSADGVRVLQVSDYYFKNGHEEWDERIGLKDPDPEAHAGLIETSEMMAIDPQGVRESLLGKRSENDYRSTGAMGDSSQASATLGRKYLSLKIEAAVRQIEKAR